MQNNFIEFKRRRELGTVISDTFSFLRKNAKPLFSVLFKTCLIPFIFLLIGVGFYTYSSAGLQPTAIINGVDNPLLLVSSVFVMMLSVLFYSALLYGTVTTYIKFYIETQNNIDIDAVRQYVQDNTFTFIKIVLLKFGIILAVALGGGVLLGAIFTTAGSVGIFVGILLGIGLLCLIIWFYTKYTVMFSAAVHGNESASDSLKKSASLVNQEWWMTFIAFFVIGILIGLIGFAFQIPLMIYMAIKAFTVIQSGSPEDLSGMFDLGTVILQTLSTGLQYILYVVPAIAGNLIYFSLKERATQSGSLEKIEDLGAH